MICCRCSLGRSICIAGRRRSTWKVSVELRHRFDCIGVCDRNGGFDGVSRSYLVLPCPVKGRTPRSNMLTLYYLVVPMIAHDLVWHGRGRAGHYMLLVSVTVRWRRIMSERVLVMVVRDRRMVERVRGVMCWDVLKLRN
jgi:hypothetical protein